MENSSNEPSKLIVPSIAELFFVFLYISSFTLGGGYAMVGVMESSLKKRKWMNLEVFLQVFTIAQSFPGVLAINTAVMIGWKLRGLGGAVSGFCGVILPPMILISVLSLFYDKITDSEYIQAFLVGVYGAMIGVVASLLFKMIKTKRWNIFLIIVAVIGTALLVLFTEYALLIFIALVLVVYMGTKKWMP